MKKGIMKIFPYHKDDAKKIADLYHSAVHAVSSVYYSLEQLEAWSQTPPDYQFWKERLDKTLPYVLKIDGILAGFIELEEGGGIDCLYTHPDYQGQGVASVLYNYAETVARSRNEKELHVYASIVAKNFFSKRGFDQVSENKVKRKGVTLRNFYMVKNLLLADNG